MPCCICGKDVTGLQAAHGETSGLEYCEECLSKFGPEHMAQPQPAEPVCNDASPADCRTVPASRPHKPASAVILIIVGSLLAFYGMTQIFPFLAYITHTTYFPINEFIITLIGLGLTIWGVLTKRK